MTPKELACRNCKALTSTKICPICKGSDLSPNWSGLVVIFRPGASYVAKTLGITAPGRYALKVT